MMCHSERSEVRRTKSKNRFPNSERDSSARPPFLSLLVRPSVRMTGAMHHAFPFLLALFLLFPTGQALAAQLDLKIGPVGVSVTPTPILGQTSKIYVSVQNVGDDDVEGATIYYDGVEQIGLKPISIRAHGQSEEVWVQWTPKTVGNHTIAIKIVPEGGQADATPINNQTSISYFVDDDHDHDGVGDKLDADDDNDSVPDTQDQFPIDPNRSKDTDGDGTEDAVDSDDDNDGLYDFEEQKLGTDPLKKDTDGDGVGDKEDAYPVDPKKSKQDVVAQPVPPSSKTIETATAAPTTTQPDEPQENIQIVTTSATSSIETASSSNDVGATLEVASPTVTPASVESSKDSSSWMLWAFAAFAAAVSGVFFFLSRRK